MGHWCDTCHGMTGGPCDWEITGGWCEDCECGDADEPTDYHEDGNVCDAKQCGEEHEVCDCSCHSGSGMWDGHYDDPPEDDFDWDSYAGPV